MLEQWTLVIESDWLLPGVPLVRVRGRLDLPAAAKIRLAVHEWLDRSPWAVVLDLSALSELRVGAVQPLVDLAYRAGMADIGLYLVTAGGAVDQMLRNREADDLFDIHHSIGSAELALGRKS
jgi:anti-anti-sigma regulatory factor